jgi:putative hydrolase of the HAD superfamily
VNIGQLKAALFDLDDTLCDDASSWIVCSRKAAEFAIDYIPGIDAQRLGETFLELSRQYWFSHESTQETRTILEVRTAQWRAALVAEGYDSSDPLPELLAQEYGKRRSSEIALFPDAISTLSALRSRGIRVAIVSNGFRATHISKVTNLGLDPHVDHVILADIFGHFKPNVRIFQHALDLCGCAPNEAVMVGDDLSNDIGGAESAGIRSFWFNPKGQPNPARSPIPSCGQITTLSEVLAFCAAYARS